MADRCLEKPILNPPSEYPAKHWELDENRQPTNQPRCWGAVMHVRVARAEGFPLLAVGIHHDGRGPTLAKQAKKNTG